MKYPTSRRPNTVSSSSPPRDETDRAWDEFVDRLKTRGERVTRSRERVFRSVMNRHDHFRADELAQELARGPGRRVSRGTVYRTLALMVETGFVRAVRDGGAHYHYEHTYGHSRHEHMICEACGSFIEFDALELARAIDKRCRERRFRERTHRISVFGICETCAERSPGAE
ncbi:transcriptional repressor [Candidatus Sumerlaeota bacterium]|nr:transcriptional repressor [Candidatus Sumerlaeota bacterium]